MRSSIDILLESAVDLDKGKKIVRKRKNKEDSCDTDDMPKKQKRQYHSRVNKSKEKELKDRDECAAIMSSLRSSSSAEESDSHASSQNNSSCSTPQPHHGHLKRLIG